MKQIIYCSKANANVGFEDIKNILEIAQEKNQEFSLSGMLLYNGNYFLQAIEGPNENIEELYKNILKDERHYDIEQIGLIDIEQRDFGKWAMGYYNTKTKVNEVVGYDNFDPYQMSFEETKKLLLKFSKGIV